MAVQNTPTDVDTEVEVSADLTTALQDTRLSDGYRAMVKAPGAPHGVWWLDKEDNTTPVGPTVVATMSGSGRWKLFVMGATGPTGPTGATGPAGPPGPVGPTPTLFAFIAVDTTTNSALFVPLPPLNILTGPTLANEALEIQFDVSGIVLSPIAGVEAIFRVLVDGAEVGGTAFSDALAATNLRQSAAFTFKAVVPPAVSHTVAVEWQVNGPGAPVASIRRGSFHSSEHASLLVRIVT